MENNNLNIYERVRAVPDEAQKEIKGGRLSGKTDINPMWRIKTLTELFGLCGVGWKYEIKEKRLEHGAGEEISAFVDILLYMKHDGEWSEGIPGTGGSKHVIAEKSGLYTNDDCFKMALTDAISVACKALGIGADIYWDRDSTKYDENNLPPPNKNEPPKKGDTTVKRTEVKEEITLVDLYKLPGAKEADNKTLFCKALEMVGMTKERGAEIVRNTFGKGTKVNDLSKTDFSLLLEEILPPKKV